MGNGEGVASKNRGSHHFSDTGSWVWPRSSTGTIGVASASTALKFSCVFLLSIGSDHNLINGLHSKASPEFIPC